MQFFNNGSYFTVTVTSREVETFASRWPCSGLRFKPVTFEFGPVLIDQDGKPWHADLVDSNDERNHPGADGGAILALSEDAMNYGLSRYRQRQS